MAESTSSSLKSTGAWVFFLGILVSGISVAFYHLGSKSGNKEAEKEFLESTLLDLNHVENIEGDFSEEKFRYFLDKMSVSYPDIVYAQALLETGHFSSSIFVENNNLFGMKKAYRRPTTCIAVKNGHAQYETWQDSVIDYLIYQRIYLKQVKTEDEYLSYLANYYAEDPLYADKIRKLQGLY